MPAPLPVYHTVDDVQSIPDDGNRYELVYGLLLVSPTPRPAHQKVVMRLAHMLLDYCRREKAGELFCVGADLTWGRKDLLVQPDLFVVGAENAGWQNWSDIVHVPLVVEVLSPSTIHHDRFYKRIAYRDQGVSVLWILDADEQYAEVWAPEAQFPVLQRKCLTWQPAAGATAFTVDLNELFAH
ncbi:MAG: Uma2 family endonuclease [Gemmatimonadaceae bacterium]